MRTTPLAVVLACTLQAVAVLAANCTVGVDIATPASVESFQCMMANGIQHVTVRSFQSNCWLDPHAAQTMKNAWEAGLVVDTYIFPSVGCDLDPASQVQVTIDHLKAEGANFNTLWLDVEDWGWGPIVDCEANQAAIRPMMEYAIQALGVERVGIYSMETMWHRIMCNTTEWNATLMWWAHWSGGESFADYYEGNQFGGWSAPFSKQWQDWGPGCLIDVDMDWRESGSCGYSEEELKQKKANEQAQQLERRLRKPIVLTEDAIAVPSEKSLEHSPITLRPKPLIPSIRPAHVKAGGNCTIGVDLATPVSTSAFECMMNEHGVQFLVVRAFQSNCYLDPHTVDTIHAAWAAGLSEVSIYFFPSVGCTMDGPTQFDVTMHHLAINNASFHRMYFDVEEWAWAPESRCADNLAWFTRLYQHAVSVLGIARVGIYSGLNSWNRITCNSTDFTDAMLWTPRWDGNASFAGFLPYGGWTQPEAKQFKGNSGACNVHLDFDYRESGEC